jgi:hypothetical protein
MATPLLFVPQMNWRDPFRETRSYLTEIRPGADGTEQRSGKRLIPTVRWEYPVTTLDGLATQTVDAILYGGQGALLAAPFWPHVTRLTAAASAGSAVVLACDTTDRDFQTTGLGAFALLIHGTGATQTVEYVATTATTGSTLTAATLTQSFPIGTLVFPARVGDPNEAVTLGRPSNRTGDLQFAFDVKVVETYGVGGATVPSTGVDAPVFDPRPIPAPSPDPTPGAVSPAQCTAHVPAGFTGVATAITVQLRDASGNALTTNGSATVAGSVTGTNTATLTFTYVSGGAFTASYTPASAGSDSVALTVNGTAISGSPYTSAVAASGAPSGTHPNEPAGFTPLFTHTFSASTPSVGVQSRLWDYTPNGLYHFEGGYHSTRFPTGLKSGVAPMTLRGWQTLNTSGYGTAYTRVYLHRRMRIPTADYLNQQTGTKLGYVGFGNTVQLNAGFLVLKGTGSANAIKTDFQLALYASKADERVSAGSVFYEANKDTRRLFTCGVWHDVEELWEMGTPDGNNGRVRIWVDGFLHHDHVNIPLLDSRYDFTRGIFTWEWTPVWGGSNNTTRTRDDTIDTDLVYISGSNA